MRTIQAPHRIDPIKLLRICGGFYECPKDSSGRRTGPLVGYAKRDKQGHQLVGDVYINFAKAERHAPVLRWVAEKIVKKAELSLPADQPPFDPRLVTGFCGAPEGGKALAVAMATHCEMQYIFPEKRVAALATESSREQSELVFGRHVPEEGERWWIVEDVCNNFSTTASIISLIEDYGAEVAGILCFLNRSTFVGEIFSPSIESGAPEFPVVALVRKLIDQYSQDDPEVADDIARGNVVWKPKDEWDRLAEATQATQNA